GWVAVDTDGTFALIDPAADVENPHRRFPIVRYTASRAPWDYRIVSGGSIRAGARSGAAAGSSLPRGIPIVAASTMTKSAPANTLKTVLRTPFSMTSRFLQRAPAILGRKFSSTQISDPGSWTNMATRLPSGCTRSSRRPFKE